MIEIENPYKWVREIAPYVIKPKNFDFGMLCLIQTDVPSDVYIAYKKYIKLCSRLIYSRKEIIVKNKKFIGFSDSESPKMQEQIEIARQLLNDGMINLNTHYN